MANRVQRKIPIMSIECVNGDNYTLHIDVARINPAVKHEKWVNGMFFTGDEYNIPKNLGNLLGTANHLC